MFEPFIEYVLYMLHVFIRSHECVYGGAIDSIGNANAKIQLFLVLTIMPLYLTAVPTYSWIIWMNAIHYA